MHTSERQDKENQSNQIHICQNQPNRYEIAETINKEHHCSVLIMSYLQDWRGNSMIAFWGNWGMSVLTKPKQRW
jgi:hypothetical protein